MNKKILIKKGVVVAVILLFISVSVIPSTGTRDVKQITMPINSGDTRYVGGNGPGNYTKIQDAIDDASDGDTVFVYNGTYYENVKINKSINLQGENKGSTIIDANGTGNVIIIKKNHITISGFTLQNSGNGADDVGIKISSNYNTISGNKILKNNVGIFIKYSSNNTISNNDISQNNWHGIFITSSSNNKIFNNIITANKRIGMVLYVLRNSLISDNIISDHEYGIYLAYCCINNKFSGNTISSSKYGIFIWESLSNRILRNNIFKNKIGIIPIYSFQLNISKNTITENNIGIYLSHSSDDTIYHNNFMKNLMDSSFSGDCKGIDPDSCRNQYLG